MADGNTPTGNPGAGRTETTSAPTPTPTAGTADVPTPANTLTGDAVGGAPVISAELTPDDFRKDGNLRADTVRRIKEGAPARGAERSFNEVTGQTTVTTTVGGVAVTFTEEGDTRGEGKRAAGMDSLARASENAEERKNG